MARSQTKYIVLHCSATKPAQDIGAEVIRRWHTEDRGWSDIGYHFVIRRNGTVEEGRDINAVGSHVGGHNHYSIGICLVGGIGSFGPEDNFTPAQWAALKELVASLIGRYPGASVLGHRDFPGVAKACPCFDARTWASANGFPAASSLLKVTTAAASPGVQTGSGVGLISGGSITEAGMQLSGVGAGWVQYVTIGLVVLGAVVTLVGLYRQMFGRVKAPGEFVEGEI